MRKILLAILLAVEIGCLAGCSSESPAPTGNYQAPPPENSGTGATGKTPRVPAPLK